MKRLMIILAMTVVVSSVAHGYVYSDYTWYTYNGHQYAITFGYGTWEDAEAEAVAVGGHLVTINDADEHAWLGLEFEQQLNQDNYLWMGFYQDHDDPDYSEPAGGWKWISGEPVTYLGWDSPEPTNHPPGEDYGTLTGSLTNHWNDWGPERPDFYPIRGIIEIYEPAGPVAYWSFDDVGDPGHDDSGNGNDGTVLGATSTDGICGKALSFDGNGDYANFGNTIGNFGTADFSVVFWFRSDTERKETVMGKRVFCGEHSFFELNMSHPPAPPGHMLIELYEGFPSIHGSFPSNQRLDDNQWHLLAITRNGNEGRLYIDGYLDASRNSAEVISISNYATFLMGNGPCYPVHSNFFSGELDEVRIYDRALSEEEIQELTGECQPEVCWVEQAKLLASDGAASDYFGVYVSVSGDYAIIGADGDDDKANWAGAAYIFKLESDGWIEQTKLTASDGAAYDRFGLRVSIDGDYAIVGAHHDDVDGLVDSGSAYIFNRDGEIWTREAKLTASDGAASDMFGGGVSISGDHAIVGAHHDDVNGIVDCGSAYIFKRDGEIWTEQAKLTASDGAAYDRFGGTISISGDCAIVGAYWNDANGLINSGAAYIFEKPASGWVDMTETAKLTASDGAANDQFGSGVYIHLDYAIVGAPGDDSRTITGSAYIFKRDGETWTQQAKLTASDGENGDFFGNFVSISGNYGIVQAIGDDNLTGAAYIFKRDGETWTEQAKLTASDGVAHDLFGNSVMSGDYIIVGAHQEGDNGVFAGSAYVFENICEPAEPEWSFVHMTDTHIGASGWVADQQPWQGLRWDARERFARALEEIADEQPTPDFILITGDIVEYASKGLYKDYLHALKPFFKVHPEVEVYPVPGNHDRYLDPDLSKYVAYVEKNRPSGVSDLNTPHDYSFEHEDLLLIGLDSGRDVSTPDDLRGTGLSTDQMTALETEVEPSEPKIVFMHHPAVDVERGLQELSEMVISENRSQFIGYCEAHNVNLVLTGHTHEAHIFDINGVKYIQTPSVGKDGEYIHGLEIEEFKHGYRIIDVQGESVVPRAYKPTEEREKKSPKLFSSGTLHVYDLYGRHTGTLDSNEVEYNIPHSYYFGHHTIQTDEGNEVLPEMIIIFDPCEDYLYEVVGTEAGSYRLEISSAEDGNEVVFEANEIPITPDAVHDYVVDWEALVQGEEGVTITIDQDGDGYFEKTLTSDEELTPEEFNIDPVADAGLDQVVECACNTSEGTKVTLDGTGSNDAEGNPLTYIWTGPFVESPANGPTPTVTLSDGCPGDYVITLVVNDGEVNSPPDDVVITVVDTTPATINSISASPNVLWPPNHKMVEVVVVVDAEDICDPAPVCEIVNVTSNEPINGPGDGNTEPDYWEITGDLTLNLRSERSGVGSGRVYTIHIECTDASGNTTAATAEVNVPYDQAKGKG